MSKVILKAENLELRVMRGRDVRLKINYNFEISEGDFVIVKGGNGSGKSTLFKAICKSGTGYFEKSGSLIYNDPENGFNNANILDIDETSAEAAKLRRSLVYIGQEDRFVSWAAARDAVYDSCWHAISNDAEYTKEQKLQKRKLLNKLIDEYFENFLIGIFSDKNEDAAEGKRKTDPYREFRRKKVTDLSGGQQKLLHVLSGVIKAKICGCKLIILDEPLNNLDGENKYRINEMFKDIMKNGDITVLVITHCQIFESINKVLTIETGNGVNVCTMQSLEKYVCHRDCLNEYNIQESSR